MSATRRYELDWLRVIAFTVLIYFHAAIFFVPFGLPLIQNAEHSAGLATFVSISSQFRLALLFFISGAGVFLPVAGALSVNSLPSGASGCCCR